MDRIWWIYNTTPSTKTSTVLYQTPSDQRHGRVSVPLFYWLCKSPLVLDESPEWSNSTQPHTAHIPFVGPDSGAGDQLLGAVSKCNVTLIPNMVSHHYTVQYNELCTTRKQSAAKSSIWSTAIKVHSPYLNVLIEPHTYILLRLCKNFHALRRTSSGSLHRGTRRCLIGHKAPCMPDHPPFCPKMQSLPFAAHPQTCPRWCPDIRLPPKCITEYMKSP